MRSFQPIPALLLLEDGTIFHGTSAGKIGTTTGEICFNTGMTGYQEVFTDPSYFGQLLVMTNDHIGNYGTAEGDVESAKVQIAGLICKNFTNAHSRPQASSSIQEYLVDENLVAICDVDTRAIVRHIRDKGAMNAIISSEITDIEELKRMLSEVPSMAGLELASRVSSKEPYFFGNEHSGIKVAVLDLGVKKNILQSLSERGCYLKVYPAKTPYSEIMEWQPDGVFISNGPGDPSAMDYAVDVVKDALNEEKPLFGICLGHQLLSRAIGINTYKMHNGHRGLNHPVKNLETGRCEITTQNHGFGVDPESVRNNNRAIITHLNLNDETVEGIRVKDKPAFSVQYHPESSPGPHDSRYLFDSFVSLIKLKQQQ